MPKTFITTIDGLGSIILGMELMTAGPQMSAGQGVKKILGTTMPALPAIAIGVGRK